MTEQHKKFLVNGIVLRGDDPHEVARRYVRVKGLPVDAPINVRISDGDDVWDLVIQSPVDPSRN